MSDLEELKKTAVLINSIKRLIGEDIFDVELIKEKIDNQVM